ncbi:glycosyltransferase family 92 protein [Nephila pilipes]|uniref:Glycosyltransferase family 92 protein n=1 Tax=Nephila pilipes TaxID=299642 RepID=A0A8X6UIJ8_NEPPI|nr:glycosyltransferase family 92 protein [Nephila pilipes]
MFSIRRILFTIILWTFACSLVFYLSSSQKFHSQSTLMFGRELLQKAVEESSDTASEKNDKLKEYVHTIDERVPANILNFLSKTSNFPLFNASSQISSRGVSSLYPSIYDLDFNNIYWQRSKISNAKFYLYSAYYDQREKVGKLPLVRIIGMVDKVKPPVSFCHFWYTKGTTIQSLSSEATYTYMWYYKWGNYKDGILQPFIISCPLPPSLPQAPNSVSLVGGKLKKISNNLKITYHNPGKREDFAVCVKGLDFLFEDLSVRLIEWIELLSILGAKKIFFYLLEVHPNISKVLSYYAKQDIIEVIPLTLPGEQPNLPGFRHMYLKSKMTNKRQNELIPYNDCLYRNLYSFKYLALLDVDEIIMPLIHGSWKSLMEEILIQAVATEKERWASYNFQNVYFLDGLLHGNEKSHNSQKENIPGYLHMLQHVYRSKNYTKPGSYVKCFHDIDRVVSLHNHFPMHCFDRCTTFSLNTSVAHLQHYRKDCVDSLKNICTEFRNNTVKDTSIWRFKDELIRRTNETLFSLKILLR